MALNTTTSLTNAAPAAPTNLKLTATANGSTLTWDAPSQADDHTPTAALRYNIVATNADGSKVFAINPADLSTGKQKVAGGYIAYLNAKSYEFKTKDFTKFYVQTIDGANVGSAFASIEYLPIAVAVDSKDKGSVADTAILAAPSCATALPKATPKIGYEFVNWTATDGITITDATLAEGATISATKAGTVTANFQETATYGVTVNAGKGVASVTGDKSGQTTLPFSSDITATMQTGYDFLNWTASPAENAAFDNAESASTSVTVSNGSVDVTANGQAHPYALTYDNLQGATHTNPATYTIEDSITFAPASDRTNYKFISWSPATIAKGNTGEKTITASWSEYAPNGAILGEFNSWSHTSHQLVDGSVTISITEAKGYWFKVMYGVDGYRNNLDVKRSNCTNLELSSTSSNDCYLRADVVGDYTFTFDTATKLLSVTFPEIATRTVYLDLSGFTGWESNAKFVVYDKSEEVAMTKVSDNANCHIYSAVVSDVDSYQFKRLWNGDEYQQWGVAALALTDGNNTCKIVGWNDPDAGVATVYAPLNDTVDNVSLISGLNGKSVAAHVLRAFPDTTYFYTLCLPFDLSNDQLKTFFGEDYKLCYLESATVDNAGTTVNMTFADRTELVAGTPYLIKPSQVVAAGWTVDATIDATMNNAVTTGATMYGLYATSVTAANAFYLQADKYLHPYSATTVAAAFRAYFTFGQTLGVAPRAVFNFTNTPTGMADINVNVNENDKVIINGQLIIIRDGVKYNAQGQKL